MEMDIDDLIHEIEHLGFGVRFLNGVYYFENINFTHDVEENIIIHDGMEYTITEFYEDFVPFVI